MEREKAVGESIMNMTKLRNENTRLKSIISDLEAEKRAIEERLEALSKEIVDLNVKISKSGKRQKKKKTSMNFASNVEENNDFSA